MDKDFNFLIEESLQLELNVAELYLLFHNLFPADRDFWWTLVSEEKNHAALVRSGKECFEPVKQFPHDLLAKSLKDLRDTNQRINSLIKRYKTSPSTREDAFNTAHKLETSAGELHFQNFMDTESNSAISDIFKTLNQDDKNHAKRICSYMKRYDIQLGGWPPLIGQPEHGYKL